MTAQTTTRTPASGTRVAPMIVVIIAILAFAAGLALAQVVAPSTASTAAAAADPVTVVAGAVAAGHGPGRRELARRLPEPEHRRRVTGRTRRPTSAHARSRRVATADVGGSPRRRPPARRRGYCWPERTASSTSRIASVTTRACSRPGQ